MRLKSLDIDEYLDSTVFNVLFHDSEEEGICVVEHATFNVEYTGMQDSIAVSLIGAFFPEPVDEKDEPLLRIVH